jgi:hypothetical protein
MLPARILCSSSPESPCHRAVTHLLRPVGGPWAGHATCDTHYPLAVAEVHLEVLELDPLAVHALQPGPEAA